MFGRAALKGGAEVEGKVQKPWIPGFIRQATGCKISFICLISQSLWFRKPVGPIWDSVWPFLQEGQE